MVLSARKLGGESACPRLQLLNSCLILFCVVDDDCLCGAGSLTPRQLDTVLALLLAAGDQALAVSIERQDRSGDAAEADGDADKDRDDVGLDKRKHQILVNPPT